MSRAAPIRVQLSRAKGWRIPENTVVVSRPSKWGNPFIVGQDGKREDCARSFAWMLNGFLALTGTPSLEEQRAYREMASTHLSELTGKNLACWCRLPKDGEQDHCHAAVLLEIANRTNKEAAAAYRKLQEKLKSADPEPAPDQVALL